MTLTSNPRGQRQSDGPVGVRGGVDECRARGCGGLLRGVGAEVYDGAIHYCMSCGRGHTMHVPDAGAVEVEVHRAPRRKRVYVRRDQCIRRSWGTLVCQNCFACWGGTHAASCAITIDARQRESSSRTQAGRRR